MRETSDANFTRDVLQNPGAVLLDVWAPWCGPCLALEPILQQLEQRFGGQLTVVKLNLDQNPMVGNTYHVSTLPTLILFRAGNAVNQYVGNPGGLAAIEGFVRQSLGV